MSTDTDGAINPGWIVLPYDIENRSTTEPNRESLLLSAFCVDDTFDDEEVIVIDNMSVDNQELFTEEMLKRCYFISHNADHEARYGVATNFLPGRFGCTLVNSKRLLSGQEGYRHDLVSEISRTLGYKYIPVWTDKDIRKEFHDIEFFKDDHILYNAADTIRLKALYYKQLELAKELGQSYLHKTLNSRCIIPIAQTEVIGIKHNTEKWLEIAKDRKVKADKLCEQLNELITTQYQVNLDLVNPALAKEKLKLENRNSRNQERKEKLEKQLKLLEEKGKTHLKSYQIQSGQLTKLLSVGVNTVTEPLSGDLINWSSPKQVFEVFRQIGMPIPKAKNNKKQVVNSVKKEARSEWMVANEGSPYEPLMLLFDSFKKIEHNIKSFGQKWVDQYVRNGRIYPSFDQAGTETGRWTSGSKGVKNKIHPNTSQIPAREGPEYRNCFEADDDRLFVTADWKNQEGVLIISMSEDMEMKKITEVSDQHSLLGTRAWRAVYKHRFERTKDPKWQVLAETYEMNKKTSEGEKARNKFKNSAGLFPVLYGAQPHKVAVTSQVTNEEAQIMIDVIKSHAPKASKTLDLARIQASTHGYVIHNDRSGSRRWFQPVLDQIHYGHMMTKTQKAEIELAGGNTRIQGGMTCPD